jgi:nucleotide-binding universal stress UspA family protein
MQRSSSTEVSASGRFAVSQETSTLYQPPSTPIGLQGKEQMMFKRILVALDGTPVSESVLAPAAILAKRAGAELVLARTPLDALALETERQRLSTRVMLDVQSYLDTLAYCLKGEGIPTRTALSLRPPAEGILELAEQEQVDLLVMATHRQSGMASLAPFSVTWQILSRSTIPVLVWHGIHTSDAAVPPYASHRFMTDPTAPLLVPLDGSPQAEAAIPVAQELAAVFGNPLLLIRAVDASCSDATRAEAEKYLKQKCREIAATGLRAASKCALESVSAFVLRCVQESHPGLVVMSAHGRGCLDLPDLGDVAQTVLSQIDAPMLLVQKKVSQTAIRRLPPAG